MSNYYENYTPTPEGHKRAQDLIALNKRRLAAEASGDEAELKIVREDLQAFHRSLYQHILDEYDNCGN